MKNQYQFQVNMKGMIALLSEHIYSSPKVFVRELLQNGMDAVTVRKGLIPDFKGRIDIHFYGNKVVFQDNGIGLTEEDVHRFLSVIGESSKKGALAEEDLIGKFGIGLLSCLVVSEEIVVESQSLYGGASVRWIGRADGTYKVERIDTLEQVGTRVILEAKATWKSLFQKEEIKQQVLYYGSALPISITLYEEEEAEQIVDGNPVWLDKQSSKEELLEYGKQVFKTRFLDVFRLESQSGELQGVAYIIPSKVNATSTKEHKVFLKRMYLGDQVHNLLPEWSSFVRCIINTNALQPTASRESLMNTGLLKQTKEELSTCFKEYLKLLSVSDVRTLERIISNHHLYIKALAVSDTEMMNLFIDYLPFETNQGIMAFQDIKNSYTHLYYTPSLDDFRQIRRIAGSQNKLVINAAYSYEHDLLHKLQKNDVSLQIRQIVPQDILQEFEDAKEVSRETRRFLSLVDKVLQKQYCKADLKNFEPQDTPAIYIANEQALSNKHIQDLKQTSNPFASTLQQIGEADKLLPTLCFNHQNELVQNLIVIDDELLLESFVHVMYVQALMLGGYAINKKEMTIFNDALYQLMVMGMTHFLKL